MVDVNDSLGKIEDRIQIVAIQGIWHLEPYLFTYQEDGCSGIPNTNNKIEGTFTDLKRT